MIEADRKNMYICLIRKLLDSINLNVIYVNINMLYLIIILSSITLQFSIGWKLDITI